MKGIFSDSLITRCRHASRIRQATLSGRIGILCLSSIVALLTIRNIIGSQTATESIFAIPEDGKNDIKFIHPKQYTSSHPNTTDISTIKKNEKKEYKINFIGPKGYGSTIMRGNQIVDELERQKEFATHQLEQESLFDYGLYDLKDDSTNIRCADICIVIGVLGNKKLFEGYLENTTKCCTIKILDVVDKYVRQAQTIRQYKNKFDGLIVNSQYMAKELRKQLHFQGDIQVLVHHSDPRWHQTKTNVTSDLQFGYIGSITSLKHTQNFLHYQKLQKAYPITFLNTDDGSIPNEVDFQIDISIRPPKTTVSKFKTTAKVATAAALGHNIITSWDEAVKDILPIDYPFALEDTSLQTVQEMFDTVQNDYYAGNQTLWNKGLEIMKDVNKRLCIEYIGKEYQTYFLRLIEKQRKETSDNTIS